jgi:hypothetical protein
MKALVYLETPAYPRNHQKQISLFLVRVQLEVTKVGLGEEVVVVEVEKGVGKVVEVEVAVPEEGLGEDLAVKGRVVRVLVVCNALYFPIIVLIFYIRFNSYHVFGQVAVDLT